MKITAIQKALQTLGYLAPNESAISGTWDAQTAAGYVQAAQAENLHPSLYEQPANEAQLPKAVLDLLSSDESSTDDENDDEQEDDEQDDEQEEEQQEDEQEEQEPEQEQQEAPADEGSNDAPADDEADDTEQENAPTDEAAAE